MYFLPSVIGVARGKRNKGSIIVLNLFLGWTIIGWVISLIWAVSHEGVVVVTEARKESLGTASELQKLYALKNEGILSDEEFEAGKKKILG